MGGGDKYGLSFGTIKGTDEKHLYSYVDAPTVKLMYDGGYEHQFENEHHDQWQNLRNSMTEINENGNPFIIIQTLK